MNFFWKFLVWFCCFVCSDSWCSVSLCTLLFLTVKSSFLENIRYIRRVYTPQFLSRHNKDLEWWTLKSPRCVTALGSRTDCVIALRLVSVTALFYLDNSKKIHLQGVWARRSKDVKRRAPHRAGERETELMDPLFICLFCFVLFCFVPGPVLCKSDQPGVLFVLPEILTPVLRPSFVLFSWAFPFQVF